LYVRLMDFCIMLGLRVIKKKNKLKVLLKHLRQVIPEAGTGRARLRDGRARLA